MMTGRNDPCPCGSGKKYKQCCLPKDRAAHAQQSKQDLISPEPEAPLKDYEMAPMANPTAIDQVPAMPEVDPLIERVNAFWESFMDAPYKKQWSLVTKMLAEEPELCDGEMVFEITNTLYGRAVDANEIERYKQLLDQLEEIVPEAYAEELHFILEWRIQIALIEEDEAGIARYFYQFSPLAGDKLDVYYRIVSTLAYHGKLEILYHGMRQARPFMAEEGVEWAYSEFTEKLGDLEIMHLLNQNPNLNAEDPTLQQHFSEYDLTIVPEMFSTALDYRTGRKTPSWSPEDFHFTMRKKKDPAKDNFALLLAAFSHYAHVVEGLLRTKVEMARDELDRYIILRRKGELGKPVAGKRRKRRSQKQKTKQDSKPSLCPDAKTLDRYLAQLMGFMSFQHYEAFALFEIIPAWLRFLTLYQLIDEETQQKTIQELAYLKGHFIQIANKNLTDPALKGAIKEWPYAPKSEVSQWLQKK